MPRRFLATRQKAVSAVEDRLRSALVYEIKRPSEGEGEQFPFACYVHSPFSLSLCLVVITCFLSHSSLSSNLCSSLSSTTITTHCCLSYLSLSLCSYLELDELIGSPDQKLQLVKASLSSSSAPPSKLVAPSPELLLPPENFFLAEQIVSIENPFAEDELPEDLRGDVDFTKIEDFFSLETKIDAKNDHTLLKLALASAPDSFMNDLISSFSLPTQRLAFIQQQRASQVVNGNAPQPLILGLGGVVSDPGKDVLISCQVCGERFGVLNRFQRHILSHPDPEAKKFLCQYCGKRFNRADHLNRHSVIHGNVTHKCLLCGEEFDRASHLDRHRRKNHPPAGQAPSQTPPTTPHEPLGDMESPVLLGTNLHLLAAVATPEDVHGLDHAPSDGINPQLDAAQVVSQILRSESLLNEASGSSSNKQSNEAIERPFVCDVCGRKFIRSTHLRRHMRIHTGEKPFSCHICGRKYARGDYLRAHINAHRRDRVHKCKHCSEIFHDLTRFANHCRQVHRDIENEDYGCVPQEPSVAEEHSINEEAFNIYEDISLSALTGGARGVATNHGHDDGEHFVEAIPIVSVAAGAVPPDKVVGFTAQDLANPFQGAEFLQVFAAAAASTGNGPHPINTSMAQNGTLSYTVGNEGGQGKGTSPVLLDPLAHLIINNTNETLEVLHGHKLH